MRPGRRYVVYAQALLPFLLPLSVLLIEPTPHRRRRMLGFTLLGCGIGLYLMGGLVAYPMQVFERHHSLVYSNPVTNPAIVGILQSSPPAAPCFFPGFAILLYWERSISRG